MMHSYVEFIEIKRAIVRNYAFVRQVIEMKRTGVKYSFAESFACKCECETSSTLSSYIFFSPRRIKGGVNWHSDLLCAK